MIAVLGLIAGTAFVNLPKLVAAHPLYPVLRQYDREAAALRSTQTVTGLTAIPAAVRRDAAALRATEAHAATSARRIAANGPRDRRMENAARSALRNASGGGDLAAYRRQAERAAAATLSAYQSAMAARTQRAIAAFAQQLRERENAQAYDLAKRDANRRMLLELKLHDLRPYPEQRAALLRQLAALERSESNASGALRAADDGRLARYAAQMRADESAAVADMAVRIRHSTAAAVAARARMAPVAPPSQLLSGAALGGAADVAGRFSSAGADINGRFAQLGEAAHASSAAAHARIAAIEAQRRALYDAIVAQIRSAARALARARHYRSVDVGTTRPAGDADLTAALARQFTTLSGLRL
jgi:hypothetical protein